jgi:HSP20 family molecular chaperone IbpA
VFRTHCSRAPLIDIYEGPDGLVLEADLPGVTEPDLEVQLQENVLTLQAKVASSPPANLRPLYLEFDPAPFERSFILSDDVDRARISADLRHGVLRLNLPRAERARTRRIEVRSS